MLGCYCGRCPPRGQQARPLADRCWGREAVLLFAIGIDDPELDCRIEFNYALILKDIAAKDLSDIDRTKLAQCKILFLSALRKSITLTGKDGWMIARIYNGLGHLYDLLDQNWKANIFYKAVLRNRQANLPPNHPDIATSLNNVGFILYKQGKNQEANTMFRQAVSIWKKNYDSPHPNLATTYGLIGCLYERRGQLLIAKVFSHHSLEIYKQSVSANHPQIGNATLRLRNLCNNLHNSRIAKTIIEIVPKDAGPMSILFFQF